MERNLDRRVEALDAGRRPGPPGAPADDLESCSRTTGAPGSSARRRVAAGGVAHRLRRRARTRSERSWTSRTASASCARDVTAMSARAPAVAHPARGRAQVPRSRRAGAPAAGCARTGAARSTASRRPTCGRSRSRTATSTRPGARSRGRLRGAAPARGRRDRSTLTVKSASHERPAVDRPARRQGVACALAADRGRGSRPTERLDPDAWPPSAAAELVDELRGGARLRPLFTISQRRERRTLHLEAGPAELTLDWVAVLRDGEAAGHRSTSSRSRRSRGPRTAWAGSPSSSRRPGYVTPEPRSKEEIARELVDGPLAPRRDRPPAGAALAGHHVPTTPSRRPAARSCACTSRGCSRTRRAPATGEDIEDLHKMRVATRRMRAVWRVFDGAYQPRVQRRYVRELRSVARALGEVRDLDVLLEGLAAYLDGTDRRPAARRWSRCGPPGGRSARRPAGGLLALLDSRAYQDFVEDYLEFTETPGSGRECGWRRTRRAGPRPRHRRVADPGRVRARSGVRDRDGLGGRHDAARAAHRGQAAALHAGVLRGRCCRSRHGRSSRAVTELQDHLGLHERRSRRGDAHS